MPVPPVEGGAGINESYSLQNGGKLVWQRLIHLVYMKNQCPEV